MYECGVIAVYISEEGKPVVQFLPTPVFHNLEPVGKAVAVRLAGQLADHIVKLLVGANPDAAQDINEVLASMSIKPHDTAKLN